MEKEKMTKDESNKEDAGAKRGTCFTRSASGKMRRTGDGNEV
jgi:hypothetical protein